MRWEILFEDVSKFVKMTHKRPLNSFVKVCLGFWKQLEPFILSAAAGQMQLQSKCDKIACHKEKTLVQSQQLTKNERAPTVREILQNLHGKSLKTDI